MVYQRLCPMEQNRIFLAQQHCAIFRHLLWPASFYQKQYFDPLFLSQK